LLTSSVRRGDNMFGSGILDVAIGVIFVYLFISLICSVIMEWVSKRLEKRAKKLEQGIRSLLSDPNGTGITGIFYNHPLIKGLSQDGKKPSYISSRIFAMVLMDIVAPSESPTGPKTFDELRSCVRTISSQDLQKTVFALLDHAEKSMKKTRDNIEKWFDEGMDRVSGWYKRESQRIIFACALAVALVLNADTISMTKILFRDPVMRAGLVAAAQEIAKQPANNPSGEAQKKIMLIHEEMDPLQFPIGWTWKSLHLFNSFWQILSKALGLFLTGLAVSLGAPFWFEVLNKFMNLRSEGAKPEKPKMVLRKR